MDDSNHNLSSALYKILDIIGASEDERTNFRQFSMTEEILYTMSGNESMSQYQFGSRFEGTTTEGLHSDEDKVLCRNSEPVVENTEDAPVHGVSYLMISDNTKPGYFDLQVVVNGDPQTIFQREVDTESEDTDIYGRILRKHERLEFFHQLKRNGPAYTDPGRHGKCEVDIVFALICKSVPIRTDFWLLKGRPCNWPMDKQLHELSHYGCFFVGVGHPHSENKSTEWRISFSIQERDLMSSLNPTQHKCYILLKMIKREIIHPRAGQKSLSSYHCKTVLLNVLEQSKTGLCTRRNLIQGVRICLSVLLSWVRRGYCPNYFLPEENMFGKIDENVLHKVAEILTDILKSGTKFLLLLKCDGVGAKVNCFLSGQSIVQVKSHAYELVKESICFNLSRQMYQFRNLILLSAGKTHVKKDCFIQILFVLQKIENTDINRDFTKDEVQSVVKAFVPHTYLQISQSIASILCTAEIEISVNTSRLFEYCQQKGNECDILSSRLILATLYLRAHMFNNCEKILLTSETLLKDYVICLCGCEGRPSPIRNESLSKLFARCSLSNSDFRKECTTGCLLFLPAQAIFVHLTLQYEMYRSVFTAPGSRTEIDWILVDSQVYLYFLQYLLYSKTKQHLKEKDAIDNLVQIINTEPNLGHRETALNLLGWIYSEENRTQEAIRCLQESWRIRPDHNAAKWHLGVLMFMIYREK